MHTTTKPHHPNTYHPPVRWRQPDLVKFHAGILKARVLVFQGRQCAHVGGGHRKGCPTGAALHQRLQQGDAQRGALPRVGACRPGVRGCVQLWLANLARVITTSSTRDALPGTSHI